MTLPTSTEIYPSISGLYPALQILTGDHHTALMDALARPSPVDCVSDAVEALFAAVKDDQALEGASLATVVAACNQMAHLLAYYQWHGKAQRGADISVAMNAIESGTAVAQACAAIDVDPRFAPVPAPSAAPAI